MFIHWYPGHMAKALRMMQEELKVINSVIYVLDARAPLSSMNGKFDELIANKPCLYILNKADMVPGSEVSKWEKYFKSKKMPVVSAVSTAKGAQKEILSAFIEINRPLIERFSEKGVRKIIRGMVIGVPNTGKSTLINCLAPRKKSVTGNKPGVTRGKQWVAINDWIELLDTPGTLYPDFSNQEKARNLAFIGSISENAVDTMELALELIAYLRNNNPAEFYARYDIDKELESVHALEEIGKKKGLLLRFGEVDAEKAAKAVITDFRKQAIGKIVLEKPPLD